MATEQPTRKVVKEFCDAGWLPGRGDGSHTKWRCPASIHSFTLPDGHKKISPGVYRNAQKALEACRCASKDT